MSSARKINCVGVKEAGFEACQALPEGLQTREYAPGLLGCIACLGACKEQQHERIAQLEIENAELLISSMSDPVTKGLNRRGFDAVFEETVEKNPNVALLFADVDHMHQVNPRIGHHGGDLLLLMTDHFLRAAVRPKDKVDRVARTGGDEFNVLLDLTDERTDHPEAHFSPAEKVIAAGSRIRSMFLMLPGVADYNQRYADDAPLGLKLYWDIYQEGASLAQMRQNADPKTTDSSEWPPLTEVDSSEIARLRLHPSLTTDFTDIVSDHLKSVKD
jgi:GGDEF domain-containing protein